MALWWRAHYDLFMTQNTKFRTWDMTWDLPVLTRDLTVELPALIWVLTWDLNSKTWYLTPRHTKPTVGSWSVLGSRLASVTPVSAVCPTAWALVSPCWLSSRLSKVIWHQRWQSLLVKEITLIGRSAQWTNGSEERKLTTTVKGQEIETNLFSHLAI